VSQCLSCQFYDRKSARAADGKGLQWGLCRRDAPQLNTTNAKTHAIEGVWPTVRDDDWCGQWQAQRKPEASAPSATLLVQNASRAQGPRTQQMSTGPRTQQMTTGTRTLPTNGGAAAIAAGYKPTAAKSSK
jgi:hypothetical protein